MQLPGTDEIEFVLSAVEDKLIAMNKDFDGHVFNGHQ